MTRSPEKDYEAPLCNEITKNLNSNMKKHKKYTQIRSVSWGLTTIRFINLTQLPCCIPLFGLWASFFLSHSTGKGLRLLVPNSRLFGGAVFLLQLKKQ